MNPIITVITLNLIFTVQIAIISVTTVFVSQRKMIVACHFKNNFLLVDWNYLILVMQNKFFLLII